MADPGAAPRLSVGRRRGEARASLRSPDPLAWLGAAYRMTAAAWVRLEREGAVETAVLRPKGRASPASLAAGFAEAYGEQKARWERSRRERSARARRLAQDIAAAASAPGPGGEEGARLPPEAEEEARALLAEAAAAPRDPLGIAVPWSELRRRR